MATMKQLIGMMILQMLLAMGAMAGWSRCEVCESQVVQVISEQFDIGCGCSEVDDLPMEPVPDSNIE